MIGLAFALVCERIQSNASFVEEIDRLAVYIYRAAVASKRGARTSELERNVLQTMRIISKREICTVRLHDTVGDERTGLDRHLGRGTRGEKSRSSDRDDLIGVLCVFERQFCAARQRDGTILRIKVTFRSRHGGRSCRNFQTTVHGEVLRRYFGSSATAQPRVVVISRAFGRINLHGAVFGPESKIPAVVHVTGNRQVLLRRVQGGFRIAVQDDATIHVKRSGIHSNNGPRPTNGECGVGVIIVFPGTDLDRSASEGDRSAAYTKHRGAFLIGIGDDVERVRILIAQRQRTVVGHANGTVDRNVLAGSRQSTAVEIDSIFSRPVDRQATRFLNGQTSILDAKGDLTVISGERRIFPLKDVSFVTTILDVVRTFQFKILRSDVGTAGQVDAVRVHVFQIRVCAVHHQLLKFSTVGLIAETDEPTVTSDITVNGDATREPIEGAVFTNVHRTTDRGHGIAVFVELPGGTDRNLASSRDVDAAFRNEGVQSGRFTKGYGTLTVDEDRMGTLTDRAYGNGSTVHGNVMTIQRVNAVLKVSGTISFDTVDCPITLACLQCFAHRKILSVNVSGKGRFPGV